MKAEDLHPEKCAWHRQPNPNWTAYDEWLRQGRKPSRLRNLTPEQRNVLFDAIRWIRCAEGRGHWKIYVNRVPPKPGEAP